MLWKQYEVIGAAMVAVPTATILVTAVTITQIMAAMHTGATIAIEPIVIVEMTIVPVVTASMGVPTVVLVRKGNVMTRVR